MITLDGNSQVRTIPPQTASNGGYIPSSKVPIGYANYEIHKYRKNNN